MYSVKILKDSIGPAKVRLTTWELTYPRFIHAEIMTHRVFSRNSASSRAIPTKRLMQNIKDNPVMPKFWGKNRAGMQASEELEGMTLLRVKNEWIRGMKNAVSSAEYFDSFDLHKQIANRVLEPWMFITVILTGTSFSNFFRLRNHKDAQPEFQWLAKEMHKQYKEATPNVLVSGQWHLPLLDESDYTEMVDKNLWVGDLTDEESNEYNAKLISAGRCARVSYLTHDGVRSIEEDIKLATRLIKNNPAHLSPTEHQAMALSVEDWNSYVFHKMASAREEGRAFNPACLGNLDGWHQFRKEVVDEDGLAFDWRNMGEEQ